MPKAMDTLETHFELWGMGRGLGGNMIRLPHGGRSTGTRLKVVLAPVREVTPQVDIPGPNSRCWGGLPHRRHEGSAWTQLANALLCMDPTQ
jgi:hypothetical protein